MKPQPQSNICDLAFSEYLSVLGSASEARQKELGQYPTHPEVARFMATRFSLPESDTLHVLDAGAGTGVLSAALVEHLLLSQRKLRRIQLTCYEVAPELLQSLRSTLSKLRRLALQSGVELIATAVDSDFVEEAARMVAGKRRKFDAVVMNPPYFKISAKSDAAGVVPEICHGQPNIYMIFMYLGARLLAEAGELVTITPRSFSSGEYFRAFRHRFFELVKPAYIHIFESRSEAFQDTSVLQENVIAKFSKHSLPRIPLSVSAGLADLNQPEPYVLPIKLLLDPNSESRILRLPSTQKQVEALRAINRYDATVRSLRLRVSTGKVVPFRNEAALAYKAGEANVPLIWMQHTKRGQVTWPKPEVSKPQYLKLTDASRPLLIRNANYVVVRRFSSKDDRHRLVASALLAKNFNCEWIALENHLNFLWSADRHLTEKQVEELAEYLNSDLVENFMRAISGNTQIGASELLDLPVPDHLAQLFSPRRETA